MLILCLIIISGGYIKFYIFGDFTFLETTMMIVSLGLGCLISFLLGNFAKINKKYEDTLAGVCMFIFYFIGYAILKKIKKQSGE